MAGVTISTKLRWVIEYPVGTPVSLNAPATGFRSYPCNIASIGGKDDEDVTLQFDFFDHNPFDPNTQFTLSVIEKSALASRPAANHTVIAYGETQ